MRGPDFTNKLWARNCAYWPELRTPRSAQIEKAHSCHSRLGFLIRVHSCSVASVTVKWDCFSNLCGDISLTSPVSSSRRGSLKYALLFNFFSLIAPGNSIYAPPPPSENCHEWKWMVFWTQIKAWFANENSQSQIAQPWYWLRGIIRLGPLASPTSGIDRDTRDIEFMQVVYVNT